MRPLTVQKASTAGLVLIAALSFILSYGNLHEFAAAYGVNPGMAWLWPVIVDTAIVTGTVLVVGGRTTFSTRSFLVAATGVSVFGNGAVGHADGVIGVAVHIVPPLFLLAVTHIVAADLHRRVTVNTTMNTTVKAPTPAPVKPAPAPTTRPGVRLVKPTPADKRTTVPATREAWTEQAREALAKARTDDAEFTPSVSWVKDVTGCSQGTASKIANDLKATIPA